MTESHRREFLQVGAAVAATAATAALSPVHAAGQEKIKVGVIGCGGRGTGAVEDSLNADPATVLWAAGDVFPGKAASMVKKYEKEYGPRLECKDRLFDGLDNYQKVIDAGCDIIMLATPPGFRPLHLEAAIKAGKHVFCEKPVAVDGPGIRKCLSLVEEAKKKNLAVVAGTQRRHQTGYLETVKRIHDGAIGDIVSTRCSWNGGEPWFRERKAGASDMEYQLNNWYHFVWLCGDHITEQHVHNLDVINWVMKGHPKKVVGQGGRISRRPGKPEDVGHIYDLFALEYEYEGGVPMYSYCSHVKNTTGDVSETVFGTKGVCKVDQYNINGKSVAKRGGEKPYVQEHVDLIKSIRDGKPLNELQAVTESTLTAIMGRMAAYSGQVITWEMALNSKETLMPEKLDIKDSLTVAPVPRPGQYKVAKS